MTETNEPETTVPSAPDYLGKCYDRVGAGLRCEDIPGVCQDQIGKQILCPQFCNFCSGKSQPNLLYLFFHCNFKQ